MLGNSVFLIAAAAAILMTISCSRRQSVSTLSTGSPTPTGHAAQPPVVTPAPASTLVPTSTVVTQSAAQVNPLVTEPFGVGETRKTLESLLYCSGYEQAVRYHPGYSTAVGDEQIQPVTIGTATYQTGMYHCWDSSLPSRLLIFKEDGEQETLRYDLQSDVQQFSCSPAYRFCEFYVRHLALPGYEIEGSDVTGWHDMNKDGLPELAVFISDGSNGWTQSQIQVLQLHPDGDVVNLTISVPPEDELEMGTFAVRDLQDLNGDGIVEWIVTDARFEFLPGHASSPGSSRIYAWDGGAYRNASPRFPMYYQPIIDDYQARLSRVSNDDVWGEGFDNLQTLLSLQMTFENAGMLEEGRVIVESYGVDYFDDADDSLAGVWRYFAEVFTAPKQGNCSGHGLAVVKQE